MISSFIQYEFLQNALFTGLLIGLIAPLLGTFIVVRRLSVLADALSHVTLSGIAFGLLLDKKFGGFVLTPFYTGMGFSVIGSLFVEQLRRVYKAYQELAIPIIMSLGVGLSVIFISVADGFNTDLFNYLFGSVSAVSRQDLWTILGVTVLVLVLIITFYKELFMLSFDEEHAVVSGIHARRIHFLFIVLTALVIAASIRIVGVLLVSALMTLPVAASIRIAKGFKQAIGYSILFGEISVVVGLISGYYFEIPPGGTIVVTAALILIMTISMKRIRRELRQKRMVA
ncbi:metal ABC transporter permease [Pontibacillus halophilus JSM 076056 = DSM 19796]|uniref:Metal ABC transporter permease n=1 Tax=Pontibacillus halophilus JSM 076056 = DSM 19796 TaxID=1385510 RepID=A0A0A5GNL6_9BACI|nr:metal ABC transporter permease [Pontibacillus halophilus]KGX92843.1 metal ABC transporter permease [Pontibacillus halophilus JSM 076056 = DSM 19796]